MKRVAAVTYCHNESFNLPVWVKYYGGLFGKENIFVFDDGSTDDTVDKLDLINVFKLPKAVHNNKRRAYLITHFANFLTEHYDYFIYTDTDEILIADPAKYDSLYKYINQLDTDYVTAIGLDVIHNYKVELPLDPERPILEQRRHVLFNPGFCKPLLTRVPLRWTGGFHFCDNPPAFDDLFLFHNKFVDLDITLARHRMNHTIERVGAKDNIWRQQEENFKKQWDELIDRPVTESFDFGEYLERFARHIQRNGAGYFIRTRVMQRGQELHRIPDRFVGVV